MVFTHPEPAVKHRLRCNLNARLAATNLQVNLKINRVIVLFNLFISETNGEKFFFVINIDFILKALFLITIIYCFFISKYINDM